MLRVSSRMGDRRLVRLDAVQPAIDVGVVRVCPCMTSWTLTGAHMCAAPRQSLQTLLLAKPALRGEVCGYLSPLIKDSRPEAWTAIADICDFFFQCLAQVGNHHRPVWHASFASYAPATSPEVWFARRLPNY